MALLEVEKGEIYYEYFEGDEAKPTVVLAHGFGMSCRVWDDTVQKLREEGYPVVAYDQRCCGQSSKDFINVDVSTMGDDLVALCGHLEIENFVLNGWSLGGAIVVDAASKLGSAVKALVLTGGATPRYTQAENFPHGGSPEDVQATVAALKADRKGFLRGLYFEGVFNQPVAESTKAQFLEIALQESPAGDDALGSLGTLDQRAVMTELNCPALVVHGSDDGVVPIGIGRFAADTLSQGELVEMPGCGHAPFVEDADSYQRHLISFLEKVSS